MAHALSACFFFRAFLETKACTLRFWCSLAELFELSVTNAGQVLQRPYEYMFQATGYTLQALLYR
jgi:hypothetical protein